MSELYKIPDVTDDQRTNLDNFLTHCLNIFIANESPHFETLKQVLAATHKIETTRQQSPYGFEWIIHTLFATSLLDTSNTPTPSLKNIRIGLKHHNQTTGKRSNPDISAEYDQNSFLFELKTAHTLEEPRVFEDLQRNKLKSRFPNCEFLWKRTYQLTVALKKKEPSRQFLSAITENHIVKVWEGALSFEVQPLETNPAATSTAYFCLLRRS